MIEEKLVQVSGLTEERSSYTWVSLNKSLILPRLT